MEEKLNPVLTEADTCREYVTPGLQQAGWSTSPHAIGEQHAITSGCIVLVGSKSRRGKQRRADSSYRPMAEVAPLVRREVTIAPEASYTELGVEVRHLATRASSVELLPTALEHLFD